MDRIKQLKMIKCREVKIPSRAYGLSVGYDFFIPEDQGQWEFKQIHPGAFYKIPSGMKVEVPEGYALIANNRSGYGSKGLIVGATIVDPGYQGEVHLSVHNVSSEPVTIDRKKALIQFILIRVETPEIHLINQFENESERSEKGFGSSDNGH